MKEIYAVVYNSSKSYVVYKNLNSAEDFMKKLVDRDKSAKLITLHPGENIKLEFVDISYEEAKMLI